MHRRRAGGVMRLLVVVVGDVDGVKDHLLVHFKNIPAKEAAVQVRLVYFIRAVSAVQIGGLIINISWS